MDTEKQALLKAFDYSKKIICVWYRAPQQNIILQNGCLCFPAIWHCFANMSEKLDLGGLDM